MSNIDLTQLVTAEQRATAALAAHAARARAECARRILAVASEHTQMNLTGAAAAGAFDAAQMEAYRAALVWIAEMRAACAALAADPAQDPLDDARWPAAPAAVLALAAAF